MYKGGFFAGLQIPFDSSFLKGKMVNLAYAPSLKVKAGERLECEPLYLGVYQRRAVDDRPLSPLPFRGEGQPSLGAAEVSPLPSESDAMVAMTSALLGPPRHGLVPMACGWHCEMQHGAYTSREMVEQEKRSVDFLAECGVDWLSDSHPWGGETAKMNALGADDRYAPGELVAAFLDHAKKKGVKVVMWSSMTNTHHWSPEGRPFQADRPEWLLTPQTLEGKPELIQQAKANCFANEPFLEWHARINRGGLTAGGYPGWAMDGSFFGDGGWFSTVIPVDCASSQHDHLPGDSNYASERALARLVAGVRRQAPIS